MIKKLLSSIVFIFLVVIVLGAFNTSSTAQAAWWENMWGKPEYGGTMNLVASDLPSNFDPYNWNSGGSYCYEPMWIVDPTKDRKDMDLSGDWTLYTNWKGNLAETWEWADPQTMVVHLRQDIYWQDKAPVNGRQFTADDVVWHFDRMLGTGNGFTTPNPFMISRVGSLVKATAMDKFTVAFKFKTSSVFVNSEAVIDQANLHLYEAPEVYAMGHPIEPAGGGKKGPPKGPKGGGGKLNSALNDWKNVVTTGPFILKNFVIGSSMEYVKNPKYWAFDERYPENRLPYVDTLKVLCIPDTATTMAALRTGKIEMMNKIPWQDANSLKKTTPDLLSKPIVEPGQGITLRCDRKPFNDIRVRKALQLALDLKTIAKGYYGGTMPSTPTGLINPATMPGFAIPYSKWSPELKDEYSYNPEKAKQLLADAGYPNGLEVVCDIFSAGMSDMQLSQVFKDYFKAVGVEMTIRPLDPGTLMNMMGSKKIDDMIHWMIAQTMPPLIGMQMYASSEPTNPLYHGDSKFDELIKTANTANSIEDAKKAVNDVDQYFLRQHWCVLTFLNYQYVFWQPYLKGFAGAKFLTNGYQARWWFDHKLKESMGH